MEVFVYEHLTGGGLLKADLPGETLCEGYGMLHTLTTDLTAAGHHVQTILDSRLKGHLKPSGGFTPHWVSSGRGWTVTFRRLVRGTDATYIIAPETDQTLPHLIGEVEELGGNPLNSPPDQVLRASDKLELHRIVENLGLPTPPTLRVDPGENPPRQSEELASRLGFPLILKPRFGAGGEGVFLAQDREQLISKLEGVGGRGGWEMIAQRYVKGVDASLSLFSWGAGVTVLGLNRQLIALGRGGSEYKGGYTPLPHPHKPLAEEAARKLGRELGGLRGYWGVDMILTPRGPMVLEVNPRLTTSYVGLREVVGVNLGDALLRGGVDGGAPREGPKFSFAYYCKLTPPSPSLWEGTDSVKIVSPPIPLPQGGFSRPLLVARAKTLTSARARIREVAEEWFG